MIAFDSEANKYDDWYKTKKGKLVDEIETRLTMEMFIPFSGMNVLDIGCGTGNYSIKLAELGCKVTAIDVSDKMLELAKKKAQLSGYNIEFQLGSCENLHFKENTFDAVFSITAIEFFKDVIKSFDEMFRVAKKSAPIVVGTINKDSSWGELYETPFFQENTVFKYANLLSKTDLGTYRQSELIDLKECLFFGPDEKDENLSIELEKSLFNKNKGGFICGLWKKQ